MSENNKVGRPRKEIDWDQLHNLCQIHCTEAEICNFFGISDETLSTRVKEHEYDNFLDYYKKHSAGGKISLRRAQWKSGLGGNVTMLIWLGKQMLGQTEKIERMEPREETKMTDQEVLRLKAEMKANDTLQAKYNVEYEELKKSFGE